MDLYKKQASMGSTYDIYNKQAPVTQGRNDYYAKHHRHGGSAQSYFAELEQMMRLPENKQSAPNPMEKRITPENERKAMGTGMGQRGMMNY
tara:strand:- start:771 stop:1043 length:273 start_codon:yes stop_codon:yes gene_type:complete